MRLVSLVAVVGIAALSVASMVGCSGASADEPAANDPATSDGAAEEVKAAVIDESSNGKTVSIALGRSFTIALSDNGASTGYVWRVQSVDKTLGAPKESMVPGDASRPGSPGIKKFTWATKSPLNLVGSHVITIEKQRPWAETAPPAATFTVTIDIKDLATAPSCGGLMGKTCAAGTYCDFPAATSCGAGDQTGKCDAKPQFCPALVLPVCGCDGKTYNNSCEANRSGATVHAAGPCAK